MKRLIALTVTLVMLASCTMTAYRTPDTAYKTEEQMKADLYDCRGSGSFVFGPLILLLPLMAIMAGVDYSAKKSCLEAKGYRVESGEETPGKQPKK